MTGEVIDHPPHYQTAVGIEAIDVMERYGLGPHLFIAMKHLLRAGNKGDLVTDLRKAEWYLGRALEQGAALLLAMPDFVRCSTILAAWVSPAIIIEAFGLKGGHARAVGCILEGASARLARPFVLSAIVSIRQAIEEAEAGHA
jgi:hypothetical protein